MKQRFLSFCAVAVVVSLAACTNDGTSSGTDDTTTTTNTTVSTPTTTTSESNYAAMADSVERNSQQGYYVNPRTGKSYSRLTVDRTTGRISDEAGEPVYRYVDRRNWWVYGDNDYNDTMNNWEQVGEARMEGEKLMYKGDGDKWIDYDTKWKKDDEEWKIKHGDTKIKVDGDDVKIKTDDGKIKSDGDGDSKIKNKDGKTKTDEDGTKRKDN